MFQDKPLQNGNMTKELDKDKYDSKISSYAIILKEYYPAPWEVYSLIKEKNLTFANNCFIIMVGQLENISRNEMMLWITYYKWKKIIKLLKTLNI